MGLRFIFMLTRNDRTVADAATHVKAALGSGLRHIGFKDVGLPFAQLKPLNALIKAGGATSYLEVVSLDRQSELTSAKAAVDIGVDVLLGGVCPDDVLPVIAGTGIRYFPFAGRISGHPSVLEGDIDDIVASAKALCARDQVDGLDLLAYRSRTDAPALMSAVCAAVAKPVIVAGSIDTAERIAAVKAAGAAGFTIGTAALCGEYPANSSDMTAQIEAIMKDVAVLNRHLSPFHAVDPGAVFSSLSAAGQAKAIGKVNTMTVSLATLGGETAWRFDAQSDELFLVHEGRALMRFRDRDEVIDQGQFIIVPRGVEYRPVALSRICEVVLLRTETPDGGNAVPDRATVISRR